MHESDKTEAEALIRHIEGLRETIDHDWQDLDRLALTDNERARIRERIQHCTHDLVALLNRIDDMEDHDRS